MTENWNEKKYLRGFGVFVLTFQLLAHPLQVFDLPSGYEVSERERERERVREGERERERRERERETETEGERGG